MEKVSLDGKWNLVIAKNKEVLENNFSPVSIDMLKNSGFLSIPASVPGNFELDMQKAGLINEPFFSTNILDLQELENRHLWYYREFDVEFPINDECFLLFKGIDTVAEIYLNGSLIAKTENMLISHEVKAPNLKSKNNQLIVHILPSTIYARRYELAPINQALPYNYESLAIRKAPHMYGWDIMPRAVSGGIWRSVYLIKKPKERIEDIYLYTFKAEVSNRRANIRAHFSIKSDQDSLKGLVLKVSGRCKNSSFSFEKELWHTYGFIDEWVDDIHFWWPRNYGEQNLYDITATLTRNGKILDTKQFRFGVRTIKLQRDSVTKFLGDGRFEFIINDQPIFVLGTNWVPLDAFHSRDLSRVDNAISLLLNCGCNMARVWGGNIYESERFFDLCDENGIMVWQDFVMACGIYPQNDEFANRLKNEAEFIIKRLRNRASLVLWSGDNECDSSFYYYRKQNPNDNFLTRKIISEAVRIHDTLRPYIPSSPYMDEFACKTGYPLAEDHPWGPRGYFKDDYYKNIVCSFASEIGYHGCPSPKSLSKFISKENLWPVLKNDTVGNDDWHIHAANMELSSNTPYAYRIPLMFKQIESVFKDSPKNLEEFSKMSQIVQAVAKKYFIERFRINKNKTTGIIWWNLLDGWPQISDAVVDYYFTKKLAYHYIARSQSPLCLMCDEPNDSLLPVFAVSDENEPKEITYTIKSITANKVLYEGSAVVLPYSSEKLCELKVNDNTDFIYIEWEEHGKKHTNHYLLNIKNLDLNEYLENLNKIGYNQFEGF